MELKTQCRERFKPAVDAINEIIKQEDNTDRPILVAIDGRCGSGKTTLGEYLKGQFDCNLFHMDDFFLRMEQRTPDRMKETGGNVDYERFYETVLIPVQKKESVCYQPFSCKEWRLLDAYEIPYKRINIIEGSYSLHPKNRYPGTETVRRKRRKKTGKRIRKIRYVEHFSDFYIGF